ncbi:hypothetical protein ACS0TY_026241 [Phlomoides rotata]
MPALRLLDLSYTRISVSGLPASLFRLTDLQALVLRSCVCLDSVPPEVEKLKTIEMLDLSGTDLYSLPNEIGELTRLKRLALSFYGLDYGSGYARLPQDLVSPDIFSKMKDLEELSIVVHPEDQRWIKIAGDIILYIRWLEKLTNLQFYFPSVEALGSFVEVSLTWKKHKVKIFKFVVGHNVKRIISRVPDEVESKYEALDQCLRLINASDVPEVMKGVLKSVEAFYLDHHLEIKSLSEFGVSNFDELKFCVVRECPNFQVTMEGQTSDDVAGAFPNLEHFGLHYLWELERVWEDPVPPGSFQALKYLMVDTCPKLEYISSQSMLRSLCKLETFIIEDCEFLKSIVKESKSAKSDTTLLPGLTALVLRHLPNLATLGSGLRPPDKIISRAFPNLEHFGLHYLWELERVWKDPVPPRSFKVLKYLIVNTCPKLQYIASQSMLQSLFNLETFIIEDCESLKSIVKESKSAKSDATLLPRLTALVLRHLPNLATLGSGLRPPDKIISRHFCPKLMVSDANEVSGLNDAFNN